ncbi:MAG: HD domain-containing protein [Elusimicrobia bacterium]|nr:HD domain-containing protein [Elusimicrobiota bacterium]
MKTKQIRSKGIDGGKKLKLLIAFHRKSLLANDLDRLSEIIAAEIKEILEAERATIFLIDKESRELYGQFALGLAEPHLKALRFPVGQGIAGWVARAGRSLNVPDAYKDSRFNPEFDKVTGFQTHSVLAVPLKDSFGETLGVLAAFNKTKSRVFNDEDEGLLGLLAGQLAATIEIFHLMEGLRLTGLESIYALAQTAEFRDQEDTAPHIRRVSGYAALLAQTIGLSPKEVEIVRVTAPLHDIGKVAIPDQILKKPGRFTDQEKIKMHKHTLHGYDMLKNFKSPLLQEASKIALNHHESYDGSGYPQGLKGEAIPLRARIVTLADSFDAMTSKRIYKAAISFEDACKEIRREAGRQFDPKLCDAFAKNLELFREAHRQSHLDDGRFSEEIRRRA